MRILNQIKTWLIGVAFFVLIIAICPIWIPVVVVMQLRSAFSLRSFRRREAGRFYLVCTAKRNWHDFLLNNVISILSENIKWDDTSLLESPEKHEKELEEMARRCAVALRRTIYTNPWV